MGRLAVHFRRATISIVVRRRADLSHATRLLGWVDNRRCRHKVRVGVGNDRRRVGTNAGLVLNRLALVTIVIRRLSGRIGRAIWFRAKGRELAWKLLRDVRIISGR